jgi:cell division septum initiation protein DivIVA
MNTIEINDKVFNEDEIRQLIDLVTELVNANETLNANIIAMNAKLGNEENKVQQLSHTLQLLISNQKIYNA